MADINEVAVEQPVIEQQQLEIPDEVRQLMDISLNGGIAPVKQEEQVIQQEQQQAIEQPSFQFETFKEKFGFEKPEDIITEIEQLRVLKQKPPVADIEFADAKSENIFKALQGGKMDEVYNFLDEQRKLDRFTTGEVTEDSAAEIIKLGMALKYKDLTPAEINYKFNKQFQIPKEPVMTDMDDEDEFKLKHSDWKEQVNSVKMDMMIEAKFAKPELEAAKSKLTLPSIEQAVDPDYQNYLQFQKELEDVQKQDAAINEAIKTFTTKQLETKLNFKDEANKIDFDFQFEPDQESFAKAIEMVTDNSKYLDSFKNADGSFNHKALLEAVYFGKNKEKVIMAAINQGKNAAIKASLPDNSNGGLNRLAPQTQELSDFDKQMQESLSIGGRRV